MSTALQGGLKQPRPSATLAWFLPITRNFGGSDN